MIKIEHLAIWVTELEDMRHFYQKWFKAVAGQQYVNHTKGFSSYFLSFDDGCRLELMHRKDIPENRNDIEQQYKGLIHFAVSVGSEEKVNELTEAMRGEGIRVIGEARWTGDGYYESVVLDPEGNRIEITI